MINEVASDDEYSNLSFIVSKGDLGCVDKAMEEIKLKINCVEVCKDLDVSTISVVSKDINYNVIILILATFTERSTFGGREGTKAWGVTFYISCSECNVSQV